MAKLLRLGEVLKEKGITARELAKATGISASHISQIVGGHAFPREDSLVKITEFLNVDLPELFYSTKARTPADALEEIRRIADQALSIEEKRKAIRKTSRK